MCTTDFFSLALLLAYRSLNSNQTLCEILSAVKGTIEAAKIELAGICKSIVLRYNAPCCTVVFYDKLVLM